MPYKGGVSPAQSGGRNKTFGGGKGGTKSTKGATTSRKTGTGTLNNGLRYNVRTTGGDDNKVTQKGNVGKPPPVRAGGPKPIKIKVRKSEVY